jgi:hypothetical protein
MQHGKWTRGHEYWSLGRYAGPAKNVAIEIRKSNNASPAGYSRRAISAAGNGRGPKVLPPVETNNCRCDPIANACADNVCRQSVLIVIHGGDGRYLEPICVTIAMRLFMGFELLPRRTPQNGSGKLATKWGSMSINACESQ